MFRIINLLYREVKSLVFLPEVWTRTIIGTFCTTEGHLRYMKIWSVIVFCKIKNWSFLFHLPFKITCLSNLTFIIFEIFIYKISQNSLDKSVFAKYLRRWLVRFFLNLIFRFSRLILNENNHKIWWSPFCLVFML